MRSLVDAHAERADLTERAMIGDQLVDSMAKLVDSMAKRARERPDRGSVRTRPTRRTRSARVVDRLAAPTGPGLVWFWTGCASAGRPGFRLRSIGRACTDREHQVRGWPESRYASP